MVDKEIEVGFIHLKPLQPGGALPPGSVDQWNGSVANLRACVERQQPNWLWTQLSGYGYSRWGAPYRLWQGLKALRRSHPNVFQAVYVHETHCAPHHLGWKGLVLSPWQKFTVGTICRQAELVFTSTPSWQRIVTDVYGLHSDDVILLPIGTNIPVADLSPSERVVERSQHGHDADKIIAVAFGSWATQLRVLNLFGKCLESAVRAGKLHRVICIGGNGATPPAALASRQSSGPLAGRLEILGYRKDTEVARILSYCNLGLVQTPRHIICKSGAFHAMVANGLPVLVDGEGDPGYGLETLQGCISPEQFEAESISPATLAKWGSELQELASAKFAWPQIAAKAIRYFDRRQSKDQRRHSLSGASNAPL